MKRLSTIILLLLFNAVTLFSQVNHLYTDANYKVSGNVHVGDVIIFPNNSKGVVFYIKPDRSGGWVVRSTDQGSTIMWADNGNTTNDVSGLANNGDIKTLLEDVDGYANTGAMRSAGNTGSCASGSVDFNNGWYVPAAGQLRKLFGVLPILEGMGIPASDFTTLNSSVNGYWSSTERNNQMAWSVKGTSSSLVGVFEANNGGQFLSQQKNTPCAVRAIHDFVMEEGTYSYLWTPNGETTPDITVSPSATTEYCVTVTYGNLCPSTDCQTITVLPDLHNVERITSCDSYVWHGTTYTTSGVYTWMDPDPEPCQGADTLYLTITNSTTGVDTQSACESYTWIDGVTYTQSTNTPTFTLTNAAGCDSIVTLHLTINNAQYGTYNKTICDYQLPYTWHGVTFTEGGDQTITVPHATAQGCDSIVTLHLTVNYATHNSESQTECNYYTWHGHTYNTSGTYIYPYDNSFGCPSVDTLHLTINHGTHNAYTAEACESYTWNGFTYNTSGTYIYPYNDGDGCPSVDTLHLTVYHGTHNVNYYTGCGSYTWNGFTYTTSGTYINPYTDEHGCPSVDTLHLTINPDLHNVEYETACGSYTWNGFTYFESGMYEFPYDNLFGCPTVDTLYLTINPDMHAVEYETACDSYTWWNGETYTESGLYTYTYQDLFGCTTTDTLYLTINPDMHAVGYETACGSYTWWNGETYTESGLYTYTYQDLFGCTITDTLFLTIYPNLEGSDSYAVCAGHFPVTFHGHVFNGPTSGSETFTHEGVAAQGCDSIWQLTVTENPNYTGAAAMCLMARPLVR